MFWDVKKTGMLNELYRPDLTFVQDCYDSYQDYAIVATKGFTFEGPFYIDRRGRIVGWDEEAGNLSPDSPVFRDLPDFIPIPAQQIGIVKEGRFAR
jgi:hypothetical protein